MLVASQFYIPYNNTVDFLESSTFVLSVNEHINICTI